MVPIEHEHGGDFFDNPIEYRGVTYDGDEEIGTATAGLIARRDRRTIINWCRKGYLPSRKIGGKRGQYKIIIADLIAVLMTPGAETPVTEDVAA